MLLCGVVGGTFRAESIGVDSDADVDGDFCCAANGYEFSDADVHADAFDALSDADAGYRHRDADFHAYADAHVYPLADAVSSLDAYFYPFSNLYPDVDEDAYLYADFHVYADSYAFPAADAHSDFYPDFYPLADGDPDAYFYAHPCAACSNRNGDPNPNPDSLTYDQTPSFSERPPFRSRAFRV